MSGPTRTPFRQGFLDHLPFFPSTLVWGVIFGAAASVSGIPGWCTTLMSAIVFSGTAQLAILKVLHSGLLGIFVTSLLVSLRFVPMVLAIGPRLAAGRLGRALAVIGIVDAGFALSMRRPAGPGLAAYVLGTSANAYLAWMVGTAAGVMLGPVIPHGWTAVTDGVIVVLFITLTVELCETRLAALAAVMGAVLAVLLGRLLPMGAALAIAALVAGIGLAPLHRDRSLDGAAEGRAA